jgi:hypothetical protein
LLAADTPRDGYGVGVCLNAATTNDLHKFLKIGRVLRPDPRSVFMAEYWTKGADDWRGPQVDTDVRSGQLRLVREGSRARCQVSEGPGKEFVTVFEKDNFGTEDLAYLRFQVTDGNKPGYAVDARLVDLRIRHDDVSSSTVTEPTAASPTPAQERRMFALKMVAGMMIIPLIAIPIGWFFHVRRRRTQHKVIHDG